MSADPITIRRVRDHLQDCNPAGVVNTMERNESIQHGQHCLFGLSADLWTIIDVIQENERLGDVMDRIVSGIMRTRWGVSDCREGSTVRYQSIQLTYLSVLCDPQLFIETIVTITFGESTSYVT